MKQEHDFSKATRGNFMGKRVHVRLPIYLEPSLQDRLEKIAIERGEDVADVVNRFLSERLDNNPAPIQR